VVERYEGTPQGGPLSPLLANVLLDEVDQALERRGHAFVRYADDCNVYVQSERAGRRVMDALRGLYAKLRLRINEDKSAVARGRPVYRERRARGVSDPMAGMAARFSRNWWRVAGHRALHVALPTAYFDGLGVPRLAAR